MHQHLKSRFLFNSYVIAANLPKRKLNKSNIHVSQFRLGFQILLVFILNTHFTGFAEFSFAMFAMKHIHRDRETYPC